MKHCQTSKISRSARSFRSGDWAFEFQLRIDQVIADSAGTITIKLAGDSNAGNNVAKIVVNPAGSGGGGGGLPVTGASTGIVAGAGVLLLAAGVFGFVIARRRRTRFVA